MSKIAVVYWSGTGNTAEMAAFVADGARGAGAEATLFTPDAFDPATVGSYDAVAFGCPAMGAEELESDEFEPVYEACKAGLAGKPVGLFGSYGWGGGEWMQEWESNAQDAGLKLVSGGVICNDGPDDEAAAACRALGAALA